MDPTGLSLPCLLDLTATPSPSAQKLSSYKKRPTTTEYHPKPFHSTTRSITKRLHDSPSHTQTGFRTTRTSIKQEYEIENEGSPSFCFSELRTAPRPLPRLYTSHQYESAVNKLNNLRDKYQKLYQNPSGDPSLEIEEDNLKEMILEAEKVFNKTYSIKYFGVKDDQLGIISKRVPMIPEKPVKSARHSFRREYSIGRKLNTESEKLKVSAQSSRSSSERRVVKPYRPLEIPANRSLHTNDAQKTTTSRTKLEDIIEEVGEAKEGVDSGLMAKTSYLSGIPEIRGMPNNYEEVDSLQHETKEGENMEDVKHSENGNTANNYVVTQYMVPRKLQPVRKTPDLRKTKGKLTPHFGSNEKLIDTKRSTQGVNALIGGDVQQDELNRMWLKVVIADQQASNTADFERKVLSLEKTKRTLLRNVGVDKVWESRVPKDELDVPERFRTYEVKKVMADSTKYSYSNLLKTMYTNERPETALVENTRKMERIISLREKKHRRYGISNGGKVNGTVMYDGDKELLTGKYVVKVDYPQENEMFNTFVKIRSSVSPSPKKKSEKNR